MQDIEDCTEYKTSEELVQIFLDYSMGQFNGCAQIFYEMFDNYFLGYNVDKLLQEKWRKFNKGLRESKIRYN